MTSASVMLGIEFLNSKKTSDITTEELRRFLVDAIQIVLGARPSTRSHIVLVKTFFSCSQDPMESEARLMS